jgi:hypothetical protein
MASTKAIHLALRTQLATASGLPTVALENRDYTPVAGTPYVEEDFVPASRSVRTLLPGGTVETMGLYVVKWYGVAKSGIDAITTGVDAILAVFLPGTSLATSDGGTVRIRTNPAPYCGQILPLDGGWAVCTITVPWRIDAALP